MANPTPSKSSKKGNSKEKEKKVQENASNSSDSQEINEKLKKRENKSRKKEESIPLFPIPLPPNDMLFQQFDNKYIAIFNQQIYAISENFDEIHRLAEERVPKPQFYIIRYVQNGVFVYGFNI